MRSQLKVLLRVKELRQDQAFRSLQAKRRQVEQATQETEQAKQAVETSAATLPDRQDAVYAEIVGKAIGRSAVDEVRERVVQLALEHTNLKDLADRAAHVQLRLEEELATASTLHRNLVKARDKCLAMTEDIEQQATAVADLKEENEVEELFVRPRRRTA